MFGFGAKENHVKYDFQIESQDNKNTFSSNANKIGAWCHVGRWKALEIDVRNFNFKEIEKYVNINILHIV